MMTKCEEHPEYDVGELVFFRSEEDIRKAMRCLYSHYAGKIATIIWKQEWYPGTNLFRYRVIVDGIIAPEIIWAGAIKKIEDCVAACESHSA